MSKQKDEAIYRKGWDDGFAKGAAAARFKLEAENEKLRELVRDMKAVIWAYDEYTSDDDCPPALPLFEDRLHELGIEVDA